jgi:hypothetical protein
MRCRILSRTAAIVAILLASLPQARADDSIDFSLSFLLRRGTELAQIAGGDCVDSTQGDRFHIALRSAEGLYIYIVHADPDGRVSALQPGRATQRKDASGNRVLDFPAPDRWFSLDGEKGIERFFIVASKQRLGELDSAVNDLLRGDKPSASFEAMEAIRRLVQQTSALKAHWQGGARIAGAFRSPAVAAGGAKALDFNVPSPYVIEIPVRH